MNTQKNRREFLKLTGFLTVSTVGTVLAGCGGAGDDLPSTLNTGPASTFLADDQLRQRLPRGTYAFPNGIASGDPKPNSVVLWTRVARANSLAMSEDLNVIVQVSTKPFDDPSIKTSDIVAAHPIATHARFNHTVHHRIEGLDAGRHYWYRFIMDNDMSIQGRTKTAPAADATTPIRFAYLSCQDWSANHWDAFRLLGEKSFDDLDFIVHLGDYIYETASDSAFQNGDAEPAHRDKPIDGPRLSGMKTNGTRYAVELNDYRYLYAKYRSDARIQALHAKFPMIATWDDHEFTDDCWTDHETYTSANGQQSDRRRNANQAWFENMPVTMDDVAFAPDQASYDNIRIYRDFAFGKVMRLIMTDERLYRSDHVVPESDGMATMEEFLANPVRSLFDPNDRNGIYYFLQNTKIDAIPGSPNIEFIFNAIIGAYTDWGMNPDKNRALLEKINGFLPTPVLESELPNVKTILSKFSGFNPARLLNAVSASFGEGAIGSRYAVRADVLARYEAKKSEPSFAMLGKEQTQWWKAKMAEAQAGGTTWKIWGNEVSFLKMPIDINRIPNGGPAGAGFVGGWPGSIIAGVISMVKYLLTTKDVRASLSSDLTDYTGDGGKHCKPGQQIILFADCWDGYPAARDELTSYLARNAIDNVIAITGDLHTFIAGQVTDRVSGKPVMLDFAGAGVSSNSFGGLFAAKMAGAGKDSPLSSLKPLLTGRGLDVNPEVGLGKLVTNLMSRPDKPNNGRDLLARALMHFSDEVQWAEGVANGFATVALDMNKATVTYHNVRVERDAAGLVQAPDTYVTNADPNSAYERRSSFTVRARSANATGTAAQIEQWPAFPLRVQEYENPAVGGTQVAGPPPARRFIQSDASIPHGSADALAVEVQAFIRQNPLNLFARIFLESLR